MILYLIKQPSISSGLRRSYNKQLEVLECCTNVNTSDENVMYLDKVIAIHKYHAGKKQWIRKPSSKSIQARCIRQHIHTTTCTTPLYTEYVMFTTVEAAQASKLILIEQLKNTYEKEIERLQTLFKRNVPNIDEPMNQLLETHPDLFI